MSTELKTLNGYGFDATKLGGLDAQYYAQGRAAHNLLDNSDFSNPIAQAGLNGIHGSTKYVCDRWISWDADATFGSGYITPGSPTDQHVSKDVIDINKTYTAAICLSDGTIKVASGTFANGFGSYATGIYCMKQSDSSIYVTVRLNTGNNIRWAALYEGSYTADTLPDYVPKGYAAELAECMRYFERIGSAESKMLGNTVYVGSGAKAFVFSIKYAPKKLKSPSVTFSDVSNYRVLFQDAVNASVYGASGITAIDDIMAENPYARFRVSISSAIDTNSWAALQRQDGAQNAYIDISADL